MGKIPVNIVSVTLPCDSRNESSAWSGLNFLTAQFWRAVLNLYLLVAQLSVAVQHFICWNSFPGIGSDGLRMNRLFACGVSNESVCCAVDMQAKMLLLWVSLLLSACGSRWSEPLIHLGFIHRPGKLCCYRMWAPAVRLWGLNRLLASIRLECHYPITHPESSSTNMQAETG